MKYRARLKTFEQVCNDSNHFEKLKSGSYQFWHPFGKHLTVRPRCFDMFGKNVKIGKRDTVKITQKKIKRIYNVYSYNSLRMVAYDYWFEWIDDAETPIFKLEEDLFEI